MEEIPGLSIPLTLYPPGTTTRDVINDKTADTSLREELDDSFYVVDLGKAVEQYRTWIKCIPRVQPFYAMKCNHDNPLVKLLAHLGTGFECGSKREIQTVLDCGVKASDIIYANTCKQESYVTFARRNGVSQMTFDNEDELYKIKRVYPDSRLVLRLAPDDTSALTRVSFKYGCPPVNTQHLLEVAKGLDLNVVGVSFHVGSGVKNPESYTEPIKAARRVFEIATKLGFQMDLLDIGGGFPGDLYAQIVPPFSQFADVINRELEQNFPGSEFPSLRIISEPGRYFAGPGYTIVLNVIARHTIDYHEENEEGSVKRGPEFRYYLNDGLYGSFLNTTKKPVTLIPEFLKERSPNEPKYPSSIWGQTCDGLDFITKSCSMNKLEVGEWVFVEELFLKKPLKSDDLETGLLRQYEKICHPEVVQV